MNVTGVGLSAAMSIRTVLEMRRQLDDLQRQLGTGKKSVDYAGLGLDRGLTIGLRAQLSAFAGYQQTIAQVGVRLDLMQTALDQFGTVTTSAKNAVLQSRFALNGGTSTQAQADTRTLLDQAVALLNTAADNRYLFAGRNVDRPPVETVEHILNGEGMRAGFAQVAAERRLADLGANGLGRLVVGAPSATAVSLTEDAVSPFGFKLAGVQSQLTGATVSGPAGTPAALTIDLGATNPNDGDTVRFSFTLPDGTSRELVLTATNSPTPAPDQFAIGATSDVTAANLGVALTQALGTLAATELVAASAVAAGNDFFDTDAANPPRRVAGPPFDSATALVAGTAADTVFWYVGDDGTDDPRGTAVARADQSLSVSYGVRASERALRRTVQSLAVFSVATFSAGDPNAEARYAALQQRVGAALVGPANEQKISDIQGELAGAQVALNAAKDRHRQTASALEGLLQGAEGVSTEEVAAKILALQTSLQGTLQTTAMLLRTNLLEYL